MPNQKGSLKDRLCSWKLFLKYKKERKKKLKEEKRQRKLLNKKTQLYASGKYYSKPKIFGLTIIGLFVGLFEKKTINSKFDIEKEITIVEENIKNGQINIRDVEKVIKIDEILKDKNFIKKDKLDNYKKRLDIIKNDIKKPEIEEIIKNNSIEIKKKNKEKQDDVELQNEDKNLKNKDFSSNKLDNIFLKQNYIPVLEVKQINKDLIKYNKQLKNIKERINVEKEYNNLFDYQFKVKQIRYKIEEILLKYEFLKQLPGFKELDSYIKIKEIDIYDIRKDEKNIKDNINLCNETLEQIEQVKTKLIENKNLKKEIVQEKEQEIKKNNTEEIKEKNKDNKLLEIVLANKIIYDNLIREQKKVAKLERSLSKMTIKKRRPTIFYYTKNLVSSIFNFTFGLFPISLFRNKMLGGLVSGFMLNNSLRSVRRILNSDIQITYIYENLEKEILSTSNYLSHMNFLLNDSLEQIENIREEVMNKYGNDNNYQVSLISYFNELDKIQAKIQFEKEKIFGLHQDLDNVYKKNKQKVLTIEQQNNYNSQ